MEYSFLNVLRPEGLRLRKDACFTARLEGVLPLPKPIGVLIVNNMSYMGWATPKALKGVNKRIYWAKQ